MMYFISIFYVIGVVLCFLYLEKQYKAYKNAHTEKFTDRSNVKEAESMMIIASLFSWLTLIALIAGKFCAYNNDYDDDYIEDSDSF